MKVLVPIKAIQELEVGDVIMNLGSINSYVVIHHSGSHATAVRSVDVSNPSEWNVYRELKKEKE
jgi:hypothetical protein